MSNISRSSILLAFAEHPCLELRQIATKHGVAIDSRDLIASLASLERDGCVQRLRGKRHRALFVLSSFEP